jgi:hypothetical protein
MAVLDAEVGKVIDMMLRWCRRSRRQENTSGVPVAVDDWEEGRSRTPPGGLHNYRDAKPDLVYNGSCHKSSDLQVTTISNTGVKSNQEAWTN